MDLIFQKKIFKKNFFIKNNLIKIGFIGRYNHQKNHHFFFKFLSLLDEKNKFLCLSSWKWYK